VREDAEGFRLDFLAVLFVPLEATDVVVDLIGVVCGLRGVFGADSGTVIVCELEMEKNKNEYEEQSS